MAEVIVSKNKQIKAIQGSQEIVDQQYFDDEKASPQNRTMMQTGVIENPMDFVRMYKDVLKIMSISPFFLFLMNTYGQNYLVLVGKESVLRNIILFCSILGFITTILLINKYQYIGVAISITFTWGIRGILTWFFAHKHKVQHG